jgi:hypothetical protein
VGGRQHGGLRRLAALLAPPPVAAAGDVSRVPDPSGL